MAKVQTTPKLLREALLFGAKTIADVKAYIELRKNSVSQISFIATKNYNPKDYGVLWNNDNDKIETKDISIVEMLEKVKAGYTFIPF